PANAMRPLRMLARSPVSKPAIACSVVVLPAPFVPMMPVIEPRRTLSDTPRTAVTTRSYVTSRFWTSSRMSSAGMPAVSRATSCAVAVMTSLIPIELEPRPKRPMAEVGDDTVHQTRDSFRYEDEKDRDQGAVDHKLQRHDVVDLRI